ncbi:MAG: 8-amino-7-oxononanoate synthase [Fibrobacter sp.]|jgi:8-amino-7-oxononanoate synthase|nr:8-amino-7-oxononanoate synthase [Fibrobacter sp.]
MTNSPIFDRIHRAIEQRKATMQLRSIPQYTDNNFIDLSTNSYLSLHCNASVLENARALTSQKYYGNLASRLVSEQSPLFSVLEQEIASWEQTECALLFNSGYAANVGILQALCTKDTEVFCDRLNHASIYDGIILSGAKLNRYRHCDMKELEERLKASCSKEKLIITDTVFSMDGDRAPLADICTLAKKYNCLIMVDEAHASGIFGNCANGLCEEDGVSDFVDIRMGTLSKSIAGLGGYCAVKSEFRDYFINFCRSFIYSTALPHPVLAHNISAIRFIRANPASGKQLLSMADSFRTGLHELGFSTLDSTTQIVPCLMESEEKALSLSAFLRNNGIIVPAIRPPTVPKGTARLRFSIFLGLTADKQHYILEQIKKWKSSL